MRSCFDHLSQTECCQADFSFCLSKNIPFYGKSLNLFKALPVYWNVSASVTLVFSCWQFIFLLLANCCKKTQAWLIIFVCLFRCIDIQQSNEGERTQALRLVRKVQYYFFFLLILFLLSHSYSNWFSHCCIALEIEWLQSCHLKDPCVISRVSLWTVGTSLQARLFIALAVVYCKLSSHIHTQTRAHAHRVRVWFQESTTGHPGWNSTPDFIPWHLLFYHKMHVCY